MGSWEYADDNNTLILNDSINALACESPDKIIVLTNVSLVNIQTHFEHFRLDLYKHLYEALAMTATEFSAWHGSGKYDFQEDICPEYSCVAFKRNSVEDRRLAWVQQPPLVQPFIDFRHISALTPKGKPRDNMPRGGGGAASIVQSLSLDEQRKVLHSVFFDYGYDLDEFLAVLSQGEKFALPELDETLQKAINAEDAWDRIGEQFSARGKMNQGGRRFAAPWFVAYLARKGIVFWPINAAQEAKNLLPRPFTPFLRTLFVPEGGRAVARSLIGPEGSQKDLTYTWAAYRDLLLTTNFFHDTSSFSHHHLLHVKGRYLLQHASDGKIHGINLLFRGVLKHHGLTTEDVSDAAEYFGGGRRTTNENAREAFGWVDRPKHHKVKKYREIFGQPPPERFPDYVIRWAADLRLLLPHFRVNSIKNKINELAPWLYWLIYVGEHYAPLTWEDIDRERHINSNGNIALTPYLDFIKSNFSGRLASQCMPTLRQAWTLAATRDGFSGKHACPIDPEIDVVEGGGGSTKSSGRTRRKALDEFVLETLIAENRRPDAEGNPFGFARSLGRFDRRVIDQKDGNEKTVFWPALPILFDAILNMGMRKYMAQWMDSGEGDEVWIDLQSYTEYPNPLPCATKGRRMAFVRLVQADHRKHVLGSFFPINKSGAYETPWVDDETARYYLMMRDWQARYNPRKFPVQAERDSLTKQYVAEDAIAAVYPVFRDPRGSNKAYPPTDGTIYSYWMELLQHCEPIVNEQRRQAAESRGKPFQREPLLVNGKPRWDIHSLRVTTVTTLIEAGVSPEVVAHLVGHKSVAMTWHYVEVNNQKTNEEVRRGLEMRRQRAVAELDNLNTNEEVDDVLSRVLGGMVSLRGDQFQGAELLTDALLSDEPGRYEVFAHGICPGGDCSTGGEYYKNSYRPVFRPRACSRCRHRVTGPVFLNGLVHRLNALMVELKDSYAKEAALNSEIEEAEDAGSSPTILEGLVRRERELRDEVWAEWAAELNTVRKAQDLLDTEEPTSKLPMVTGMDLNGLRATFKSVHQLALLHGVVSESNIITGSTLEVPPGARAKRDEMLLEIARKNDAAAFFYKLPPDTRKRALDAFGDLLTHHVIQGDNSEMDEDRIEGLLQGSEKMPRLGEMAERICHEASNNTTSVSARNKV